MVASPRQPVKRETPIKREIRAALGKEPWCVIRNNPVGTARYGKACVPYGAGGVGAPDLIIEVLVPSRVWACVWMEVKAEDNGLDPDQIVWHTAACSPRGEHGTPPHHAFIVRSAAAAHALASAFHAGRVPTQTNREGYPVD